MGIVALETNAFGRLEVEEEKIVRFPHGIPGFVNSRQFVLLPINEELPFSYLQSIDDEKLSFLVVDPFVFFPKYEFVLHYEEKEELSIESEEHVIVLTILSVQDDLKQATANLLAPIVINAKTATGKQVILHDTQYTTKHRLLPEQVGGK